MLTEVSKSLESARPINYAAPQTNTKHQAHPSQSLRALALVALGITEAYLAVSLTGGTTLDVHAMLRRSLAVDMSAELGNPSTGLYSARSRHLRANHFPSIIVEEEHSELWIRDYIGSSKRTRSLVPSSLLAILCGLVYRPACRLNLISKRIKGK